ncbi:amidohydrolase [Alkaliphilus metalliredigens QYMF]|uniref:Amidohydrolase n=1 Tax=Alkaliphilus metalliredigens (strain QYMF) TaxID=293826 RepID=A6TSC3_ALKMQ|nr:M20 family metallopeptidase [Alkaliphilus metalliredigens]ABR49091.1 amidohydrolase [Alkaliphilus metalliredigens QYMF]
MEIKDVVKKYNDYVIQMRRDFHMNPESSWEEFRTSGIVKAELDKLSIPYISVAGTGVVATIKGIGAGKIVALRADMDALEIEETNDVPYKSKFPGKMHACGHDGHTAMLLGAAKVFNEMKHEINGTVKLIFQPAEEVAAGARKMLDESNFMDDVDGSFAIHLWSGIEVGKISIEAGPRMASADIFEIIINGKSGHGSMPHQAIDAVVAASAVVMDLQSVVSREFSPLDSVVLSIGSFHAGTRFNIIANKAILSGTTRCFKNKIRDMLPSVMERIVKNTAASYRAEATLKYTPGTPPTINDPTCAKIAAGSVEKILGENGVVEMEKTTGGEDFALFLNKAPGVMAFVGMRNEEKDACYAHHHERFNMDEDALEIGTALYVQYALDFLNN